MIVLIAIAMPVLLILVAFAVQLAYMDLTRVELRTAVDAAAEAGARALSDTGEIEAARIAAQDAAQQNLVAGAPFELPDDDVIFGTVVRSDDASRFDFTENSDNPNAVRIATSAQRNQILGVLGGSFFTVNMQAVAGQIDRDVVLVLDRSGSMARVNDAGNDTGWTDGQPAPPNSRWQHAADAAAEFLDTLQNDTVMQEKVGLVTYNGAATIDNDLTFDYSSLVDSIDDYTAAYADGWTNIADGIEKGRQALIDQGFDRSWAAKTIVVMTDGKHNSGSITPQEAATVAAAQGITIHTITYGADAEQTPMQEVAAIGYGQHWHAPSGSALLDVFEEIAANLPTMLME
jgi:Flp pilus assembly protein TadG